MDDPLSQNLITSCVISHGLLYFGEACFRGQVKVNPVLLLHHVLFFLLPIMTFHSRSVITFKARPFPGACAHAYAAFEQGVPWMPHGSCSSLSARSAPQ